VELATIKIAASARAGELRAPRMGRPTQETIPPREALSAWMAGRRRDTGVAPSHRDAAVVISATRSCVSCAVGSWGSVPAGSAAR
jgi:hypothetical protein